MKFYIFINWTRTKQTQAICKLILIFIGVEEMDSMPWTFHYLASTTTVQLFENKSTEMKFTLAISLIYQSQNTNIVIQTINFLYEAY